MAYKQGDGVIVTQDSVNRVGVVIGKRIVNKVTTYDVLMENRSAIALLTTGKSKQTYINRELTNKLCETGQITPNINYRELVANDELPMMTS